jgi:glycosyltransferase involved in cell wall biosynthesis
MKLVVQIPAYNEEALIKRAVENVRRNFPIAPFDHVEIVVINDASTDNTVQAAQGAQIKHVVSLKEHGGLGVVFKKGLAYCLDIGADVIVNIDADLQYRGEEIPLLIKPIVDQQADMVIGNRQLDLIPDYPKAKRLTQSAGNRLISTLYHGDIKDSTSGFRAMSRGCAQLLVAHLANTYTYTIESICILLNKKQRIYFVPININKDLRESRLIKNKIYYIQNYLQTVFRHKK